MHPGAVLQKISKNTDFWTAKMVPKLSKNSLKFIKKSMPRRTSWNLKKHCISAVKTLKSRSRHHQKASKTAAKNESEKEVKKVPKKIRRWKFQLADLLPIPPPNPPPRFLILAFMKRSAPLRPKGTPLKALPVIRRPTGSGRVEGRACILSFS